MEATFAGCSQVTIDVLIQWNNCLGYNSDVLNGNLFAKIFALKPETTLV